MIAHALCHVGIREHLVVHDFLGCADVPEKIEHASRKALLPLKMTMHFKRRMQAMSVQTLGSQRPPMLRDSGVMHGRLPEGGARYALGRP